MTLMMLVLNYIHPIMVQHGYWSMFQLIESDSSSIIMYHRVTWVNLDIKTIAGISPSGMNLPLAVLLSLR